MVGQLSKSEAGGGHGPPELVGVHLSGGGSHAGDPQRVCLVDGGQLSAG